MEHRRCRQRFRRGPSVVPAVCREPVALGFLARAEVPGGISPVTPRRSFRSGPEPPPPTIYREGEAARTRSIRGQDDEAASCRDGLAPRVSGRGGPQPPMSIQRRTVDRQYAKPDLWITAPKVREFWRRLKGAELGCFIPGSASPVVRNRAVTNSRTGIVGDALTTRP